jgi:rRNA maturation endonuclease Nob1
MDRFEHICEVCDTEFAVETEDETVSFCPCCGEPLTDLEDQSWDDDWEEDED